MILFCLAIAAGFAMLAWGADRFVDGASTMARALGVSPMIIGLTIVSLGTSSPEIVVAIMASAGGSPSLAIGNALGSNIANIALVLGLTALIVPVTVRSHLLKREIPMLFLVMLLALGLMLDGALGRMDGIVLLAGLGLMFWWLISLGLRGRPDILQAEYADTIPFSRSIRVSAMWFGAGLVLLLAGSRLVVWGSVQVAQAFGISDLVIGLTIVAVGTSLPELMASIVSVLKKEPDIAIGNVVGSNMVNILAVLSMPALIHPSDIEPQILSRDMPVMFLLTLGLLLMARGSGSISRYEGALLTLSFGAYIFLLYMQA